MDNADMVWISICHPVEFEKNTEGVWTWKYVENDKGKTTPMFVSRTISYVELYDKVKEVLNFDSRLYEMKMACLVPMVCKAPAAPTIIDCDNNVQWFIAVCRETFLCITLVEKTVEHRELVDVDACLSRVDGEEQLHMNGDEDFVQIENVAIDDNGDGRLLHWNNFDVIQDYPERDVVVNNPLEAMDGANLIATENHNQNMIDDNNDGLNAHETQSQTLGDGNVAVRTNESGSRVVVSSFSSVHCGSSVRIPESLNVKVRQLFPTKKGLIQKMLSMAMECHFEFKVKKSNKSIYEVVCIEDKCTWRLRATKFKNSDIFEVRKYQSNHTCSMSVRRKDHKHASYIVIGNHIAPKFQDANRLYRPRDIISDIRREFGITLSYTKAYMAKYYAMGLIRGKPSESYAKLPSYSHVLELQNPGTVTFIHTTKKERFKYFFMALGPSIRGFLNSMRRVISVDGTHLTSSHKGTLLVATCQDANYQIYPLAWAIVDSENNKSWGWFFEKLKLITGDTEELAIISDRARCIKNGFQKVFEFAHQGNCMYHLQRNLKTRFPRCDIAHLFKATAEAYTIPEFENNLVALFSKAEGISDYLLEEDYCYWARAHFSGVRYNIMTTNNAESLNSLLKSAREFPIIGLIDYIRETQQRWFYERHVAAEKCTSVLTPSLEKKMLQMYNEAEGLEVKPISPDVYDVGDNLEHHIVDLEARRCTCKKFDLDKFPCAHAIAVIRFNGDNGYNFCSLYYSTTYWRQSYSEFVYPLPKEDEWKIPEYVLTRKVLQPLVKRQSGRPSQNRKRSAGESRKPRKCSKCQKTGHNRATCTSLVVPEDE